MKQAYVKVTYGFLESILKLPDSIDVTKVVAHGRIGPPNTFVVCLEGDGLPEQKPGEMSQHVKVVYEKLFDDLVPNIRLKEIKKI